ncbi:uncharacterized protein LOC106669802 [Cimex lectularius]|uniref:Uncharacterized protein n=1 Tax=Cimex lectularius TaxID=79782 RepID=A0A8I6S3B5_CIMLE|nr:uncharacterized protein LOC106669802 [Cimex lectularius]
MSRLPPHPLQRKDKKFHASPTPPGLAKNQAKLDYTGTRTRKAQIKSGSPKWPGERYATHSTNSSDGTMNIASKVTAKVDTWRTRPSREELEKRRRKLTFAHKKQPGKNSSEQIYLSRLKTEKMLEEVNLLLTMSQVDKNLKTSKSYLRSVQRTLCRSLRKGSNVINIPEIDPEILSLVHEPITKQLKGTGMFQTKIVQSSTIYQNSNFILPQSCSESDHTLSTKETEYSDVKSFTSRTEPNKTDESDDQIITVINNDKEITQTCKKEEEEHPSTVRSLLSFWNEKFENRPMTVCYDLYTTSRQSLTGKEQRKTIELSSDGVAEEHTLKPSELKTVNKGASNIVDLLRINYAKRLQKSASHNDFTSCALKKTCEEDNNIISNNMFDERMKQNQKNVSAITTKANKTANDNRVFKRCSVLHTSTGRNKKKSNHLNTIHKTKKKPRKLKMQTSNLRLVEVLKKEYSIPISYPYLYLVKCLEDYSTEMKPGVYRPIPRLEILSEPIDAPDANYDFDQKYFNLRDYRSLTRPCTPSRDIVNGGECKMSLEKISIITGIKPDILNTLVQIIKKENPPEQLCTLNRSDLEKLYQIGNELVMKDSSTKGIFFYFLSNIDTVVRSNKEYIKVAYLKTMSYLLKLPPAVREIGQFGAMETLSVDRMYFTATVSLVILGLSMLVASSI